MRIRKIERDPGRDTRNYYLVDACFLANKYIPPVAPPQAIASMKPGAYDKECRRIEACKDWWSEIEAQLKKDRARVYIPDICIAECFKVLAKEYYEKKWFKNSASYGAARRTLREDVSISAKGLTGQERKIRFHDVPTNRDIIISVDRFYEPFSKAGRQVSVPDLILLATAKYLMDFFDLPKSRLFIVTIDYALYEGTKKIAELPRPFYPIKPSHSAAKVFRDSSSSDVQQDLLEGGQA